MSEPGSSSIHSATERPSPSDSLPVRALLAGGMALVLFAAPAMPGHLEDWPALRANLFFQGLGLTHPAAPGDGLLAFLLQPMFGTGNVLAHIVWELAAAIFLALLAVFPTSEASRRRRMVELALLFVLSLILREAAWWFAAALAARMLWRRKTPEWAFGFGVVLGIFGLLSFMFCVWGAGVVLLSCFSPDRHRREVAASCAGWIATLLTGWTVADGSPLEFGNFVGAGAVSLASRPVWQLAAALVLGVMALRPPIRRREKAMPLFTAACALCAITLGNQTARTVGANLRDSISSRARAWSILSHPGRFANRVLLPAWRRLGAEAAIPAIAGELGNAPVDVLGDAQLVAVANSLRHLPGSRNAEARGVLVPASFDPGRELKPRFFHRLMIENGFALYVHDVPARAGFSTWPLSKFVAFSNSPSLMESSAPPSAGAREGTAVAGFRVPAHLMFGPIPFASKGVVGKYYWEGGPGRVVVSLRQADGGRTLLMERGLNPAVQPADRGLQNFALDLPETTTAWVDLEMLPIFPADASGVFQMVDVEFKRDLTRMMSTTLTPDVLHDGAGFNTMPAIIFSANEAAPGRSERGQSKLLVHMPAAVAFAKPREAVRLTGIFGFLPGAYEHPDAGTAGAVFNVMWFSGNDGAKQIFSRTLKPKTEAGDRGPQKFDLDLSGLPDGILSFTISPAVAGDISWGWTYLGEIDIRRDKEDDDATRFNETMDAYRAGLRPLPALLKTNEQKPRLIEAGDAQLLRVHAPGEALFGVTAGHTKATGKFGFADEAWESSDRTDGADFVVLWRDHHGDVELFRQHLQPVTNSADRGVHQFSVDLTGRGNGLLVLRSEPGPAYNNYWDWTGWSDLTVW